MSNFSYIDGMPVKISERFKPLPKVFQIPQAIASKIQQSNQHYNDSPQFSYDFHVEKNVIAQVTNWQCMRQNERELRKERQQRREEMRLRAIEQQHKQMLGAVNYPDAEELSMDDSDGDDNDDEPQVIEATKTAETAFSAKNAVSSFHNILKPIILPQSSAGVQSGKGWTHNSTCHTRNKSSSSFNYKDFEEDTSSPFDNIELKTINDLDILAQVLRHSQINPGEEIKNNSLEEKINFGEIGSNIENDLELKAKEKKDSKLISTNMQNITNETSSWQEGDFNTSSQHMNIPANYSNPANFVYSSVTGSLGQPQLQGCVDNQNYVISGSPCNGEYEFQLKASQATTMSHITGINANTYAAIPLPVFENSSRTFSSNTASKSEVKH